ncbi:MAG: cytochrome P450, partial [Luteitalea sp.]|nr:cytochrome P450 [Luteitalea sp.]
MRDLDRLSYTLRVVKEAMRLYPPAARQFRVTSKDVDLGEHTVPEATPVMVCHYLLHRGADSFPDPDDFIPERFGPDSPPRHPLAHIPFGTGNRVCLGRHYATLEIHLLLAMLVGRFRFSFPSPLDPRLGVTLRPRERGTVLVARRGYSPGGDSSLRRSGSCRPEVGDPEMAVMERP